jgi:hypothetical protein
MTLLRCVKFAAAGLQRIPPAFAARKTLRPPVCRWIHEPNALACRVRPPASSVPSPARIEEGGRHRPPKLGRYRPARAGNPPFPLRSLFRSRDLRLPRPFSRDRTITFARLGDVGAVGPCGTAIHVRRSVRLTGGEAYNSGSTTMSPTSLEKRRGGGAALQAAMGAKGLGVVASWTVPLATGRPAAVAGPFTTEAEGGVVKDEGPAQGCGTMSPKSLGGPGQPASAPLMVAAQQKAV